MGVFLPLHSNVVDLLLRVRVNRGVLDAPRSLESDLHPDPIIYNISDCELADNLTLRSDGFGTPHLVFSSLDTDSVLDHLDPPNPDLVHLLDPKIETPHTNSNTWPWRENRVVNKTST